MLFVRALLALALFGGLVASPVFSGGQRLASGPHTGDSGMPVRLPWPEMVVPPDNPTTRAKVELGRLLFYDPILSNNNSISCAHCHHPDLGFSDGLPRALGYGGDGAGRERTGGVKLARRTPTLWNVGYAGRQFWDGRAENLEEQCRHPITDPDEMKQDPDTLVHELHHIPEYEALFDRAFGGRKGASISLDNVTRAIAAFQRTLVSRNSRFDRYAAGTLAALNDSEKRGLRIFFSEKTRCAECHIPPNLASPDFLVTGVPNVPGLPGDPHKKGAGPGRGGGPNGAYKVPTLRNVALKPPYMHNGSLKTLAEVVDFYAKGGGRGRGLDVPLQDGRVTGFKITSQERADLVAFLKSLTDVSAMPPVPREVPSGLEVVKRFAGGPKGKQRNWK